MKNPESRALEPQARRVGKPETCASLSGQEDLRIGLSTMAVEQHVEDVCE